MSRLARPAVPVAGGPRRREREPSRRQDKGTTVDLLAPRHGAAHLAAQRVERAHLQPSEHLHFAVLERRPERADHGGGVLSLARVDPAPAFPLGDDAAPEEEGDSLFRAELPQRRQEKIPAPPVAVGERLRVVLRAGEVASPTARDHQLAPELLVFLDQRGAGAVLGRSRGGHHSGGTAADHDNVKCAHRFCSLWCAENFALKKVHRRRAPFAGAGRGASRRPSARDGFLRPRPVSAKSPL